MLNYPLTEEGDQAAEEIYAAAGLPGRSHLDVRMVSGAVASASRGMDDEWEEDDAATQAELEAQYEEGDKGGEW